MMQISRMYLAFILLLFLNEKSVLPLSALLESNTVDVGFFDYLSGESCCFREQLLSASLPQFLGSHGCYGKLLLLRILSIIASVELLHHEFQVLPFSFSVLC